MHTGSHAYLPDTNEYLSGTRSKKSLHYFFAKQKRCWHAVSPIHASEALRIIPSPTFPPTTYPANSPHTCFFHRSISYQASVCKRITLRKSPCRHTEKPFPRAHIGFPVWRESLFRMSWKTSGEHQFHKVLIYNKLYWHIKTSLYRDRMYSGCLCVILRDFTLYEYSSSFNYITWIYVSGFSEKKQSSVERNHIATDGQWESWHNMCPTHYRYIFQQDSYPVQPFGLEFPTSSLIRHSAKALKPARKYIWKLKNWGNQMIVSIRTAIDICVSGFSD